VQIDLKFLVVHCSIIVSILFIRAGMEVDFGWPCTGPLLKLAEMVARKLLPAFDVRGIIYLRILRLFSWIG
jgi:hypothetical protein